MPQNNQTLSLLAHLMHRHLTLDLIAAALTELLTRTRCVYMPDPAEVYMARPSAT